MMHLSSKDRSDLGARAPINSNRLRASLDNVNGLTLIETMVAIMIIGFIFAAVLYSYESANKAALLNQTRATQDRIILGIRSLAGSPAALRNSMRAVSLDGVTPANAELLACAGGNPLNACKTGITYPLMLYAPLIRYDGSGTPLIQPIAAPIGGTTTLRFDDWGNPCDDDANTDCPLIVSTSFQAQCGPAAMSAADLANPLTAAQIGPKATCTVASEVSVKYVVQLNPNSNRPGLMAFSKPIEGVIVTSVLKISGNTPQ